MFHLLLWLIFLPIYITPALYTGGYWFKHSINKLKSELVTGQTLTPVEISDAQLTAFMIGFFWPIGLVGIALRRPALNAIKAGAKAADKNDVQLIALADPHYRAALEEVNKEFPMPTSANVLNECIEAEHREKQRKTNRFAKNYYANF